MATSPIINRENASALISPEESKEIIQSVVEKSTAFKLMQRLPDMSTNVREYPIMDSYPIAGVVEEDTGLKITTDMKWKKDSLIAGEIASIIPVPDNVAADSDYNIFEQLKPRLEEAAGKVADEAIFFGKGRFSKWPNGLIPQAITAGNVVTATTDIYKDVFDVNGLLAKVEEDGYFPDSIISGITMMAKLRGLRDTSNRPMFLENMHQGATYTLAGMSMDFPRNGMWDDTQALMVTGDWKQAVYAMRQDVTYKMLDQATIIDPTTKEVVYSLAQQDMVALRAVMRLGWEIPNPINAFQPNESLRSPFAVYKPASAGPNVNLSNLAIGSLTLTPAFDKSVTSYTASTTNATNTITATPEDSSATVAIKNGVETVQNGSAATWVSGSNTVTATVTNGSASKQYTVTVTKS